MTDNTIASFRIVVAIAVMLAGAAWQPLRAEDSGPQHGSDSGSCARSAFRVLIDVGHTATSPGADSARGVPEYEFNLKLADVIAQSLHEAGFDKAIRLVTSGTRMASLFERAARANNLHSDLFISIHHDSVPQAVTAAVEEFCASPELVVTGQLPPSKQAGVAVTRPSRAIRPASLSRHRRIRSAKS